MYHALRKACTQQKVVFFHPDYLLKLDKFWRRRGQRAPRLSTGMMLASTALEICEQVCVCVCVASEEVPVQSEVSMSLCRRKRRKTLNRTGTSTHSCLTLVPTPKRFRLLTANCNSGHHPLMELMQDVHTFPKAAMLHKGLPKKFTVYCVEGFGEVHKAHK